MGDFPSVLFKSIDVWKKQVNSWKESEKLYDRTQTPLESNSVGPLDFFVIPGNLGGELVVDWEKIKSHNP